MLDRRTELNPPFGLNERPIRNLTLDCGRRNIRRPRRGGHAYRQHHSDQANVFHRINIHKNLTLFDFRRVYNMKALEAGKEL
jgi:hypothetical protein